MIDIQTSARVCLGSTLLVGLCCCPPLPVSTGQLAHLLKRHDVVQQPFGFVESIDRIDVRAEGIVGLRPLGVHRADRFQRYLMPAFISRQKPRSYGQPDGLARIGGLDSVVLGQRLLGQLVDPAIGFGFQHVFAIGVEAFDFVDQTPCQLTRLSGADLNFQFLECGGLGQVKSLLADFGFDGSL
jgi:hypothetical protein